MVTRGEIEPRQQYSQSSREKQKAQKKRKSTSNLGGLDMIYDR